MAAPSKSRTNLDAWKRDAELKRDAVRLPIKYWSLSSLMAFLRNPLAWYKRYVENLPRTRHMITPTIERAWHLYLTYASVVDGPNSVLKQIVCEKP